MQRLATTLLSLAAIAGAPLGGAAQPLPQHVLSRGGVSTVRPVPVPAVQHRLYGQIRALRPTTLLLLTRQGRLQVVDDSLPLRTGLYSAPLFVGKIVVVMGNYDAKRLLHAVTITRMTRLDPDTPGDR